MTFWFNFHIFILVANLLACKPKVEKSEIKNFRAGKKTDNSCFSNYVYHKRLSEQLEFLGHEFLESCFAESSPLALAGTDQTMSPASIWEGYYNSSNVNIYSIFRNNNTFSNQIYNQFQNTNQNTDTDSVNYFDYLTLPEIFRPGGKLHFLKIASSPLDLSFTKANSLQDAQKWDSWKNKLSRFSPVCRSHLTTIYDLATEIKNVTNKFVEKRCCGEDGQGEWDKSSNALICQNKPQSYTHVPAVDPRAPTNFGEPETYYEWPVCGMKRTCSSENRITDEFDIEKCARCELRMPISQKYEFYNPSTQDGNNSNFDQSLADATRITCLNPAAARSASTTALINLCNQRPDSEACEGINYFLDVKDLYKKLTPYLHCERVESNNQKIKMDSNNLTQYSATRTMIDFVSSASASGSASVSTSVKIPIGKFEGSLGLNKSSSGTMIYQIRQEGTDPIFVMRGGRVELGPKIMANCSNILSENNCTEGSAKLGLGFDISIVSLTGEIKSTANSCKGSNILTGTDWGSLPYVGGLSLSQIKTICEQLSFTRYDSVTTQLKNLFSSKKDWFQTAEFFKLDISRKNIYCATKTYRFTFESDTQLVREGVKLGEVYLNLDKGQVNLGVRSFDNGKWLQKTLDRQVLIPNYDFENHSTFAELMKPIVTSKEILDIFEKHLYKQIDKIGTTTLSDQVCRAVILPVKEVFSEKLVCKMQTALGARGFKDVIFNELNLSFNEANELRMQTDADIGILTDLKANSNELPHWIKRFKEGSLSKQDMIDLLQTMAALKKVRLSGCTASAQDHNFYLSE